MKILTFIISDSIGLVQVKLFFFAKIMELYFASLNSGSNGNCYYVGNKSEAVLIDVGISCRETEKRMKKLGLSMQTVKAIFVSHEHGDHIKGVSTLANKYSLPVYITSKTAVNGPRLIRHLSLTFAANESIAIGDLMIKPFSKFHDAADPHSFTISYNNITVGVITDIGRVCSEVVQHFKQCHAVFLESNYDTAMLENGKYPVYLKNRIRDGLGHISNDEALELFINHRSPSLSHVLLSHLSKENNSPEMVKTLFEPHAKGTKIIVASRYVHSEIYCIGSSKNNTKKTATPFTRSSQLDLFG